MEEQSEWSKDSKFTKCDYYQFKILIQFVVDRVKWFRERASRDRQREEAEILEAEFQRTVISHSRMADVWCKLATNCGPRLGAAAYAWKKHAMYTELAKNCTEWYEKAKSLKTGMGLK